MSPPTTTGRDADSIPTRRELWRRFRAERREPRPFSDAVARTALVHLEGRLDGARVLDLGCGDGEATRMLSEQGATTLAGDLEAANAEQAARHAPSAQLDGRSLPFPDTSFDGVYCSNVLEHTPDPHEIIDQMARVTRPGGWCYLSWTPWLSPWGGHAVAPFHYLGPRRGVSAYRRLFGAPRGPNVPLVRLWPTHVGEILSFIDGHEALEVMDACPRYYPAQRWMMRVPGVREILTWNAVIFCERR